MSYKGYKHRFEGGATVQDAEMCRVDAELLNWLSFHIQPTLAGAPPNITFMIQESNDGQNWIDTSVTKAYTTAGTKSDMLAVSQATSRYYRVIPSSIAAGSITEFVIFAIGKG